MMISLRNGMIGSQTKNSTADVAMEDVKALKNKCTPRDYMEKSIEIMKSSIQERRADSKPSPYVGAVIVFQDGRFDTAFRGELREGDHAEYTLLERKHRSDNLAESTLYATLEPCAPNARHFPKLGCAERIVNARVKKVYVGIEDPDPTVAGKGIKYLESCGIEVEMYPRDLQRQIEKVNEQFLKAAIDRAKRFDEESIANKLSTPIEHVATSVHLDDLSGSLLRKFADKVGLSSDDADKFSRQLAQIGILEFSNGAYIPTGIGYLLFGVNPQLKYPQASINCIFRRPDNTEDIYKIGGPLVEQPEQLYKWYESRMPGQIDRSLPVRQKIYDYPYEVVNELVKNAILHRDYTIEGAPIYFELSDDEIVIKSPGLPLDPITMEAIKSFSAPSLSRNPKIMFVFEAMKLAEQRGFGFDTVRNIRSDYNLPLPIVTYEKPYIVFTLPRSSKSVIVSPYTEREQNIIDILRINGTQPRRMIEEQCGCNSKMVIRTLESLIRKGVVVVLGHKRGTRYALRDGTLGHNMDLGVSKKPIQMELNMDLRHNSDSNVSKDVDLSPTNTIVD